MPNIIDRIKADYTANQAGQERPPLSVTGYPTVEVSDEQRRVMYAALRRQGMVVHSAQGELVWAVTQECRKRHEPYEVKVARDPSRSIMGVTIQLSNALIDMETPPDWDIELIERYSGFGAKAEYIASAPAKPAVNPKPSGPGM